MTVLIQIIKFPLPVRPDCKNINAIAAYVIYFLSFIFLDDDFIGKACSPDCVDSFHQGLLNIDLPAAFIKVFRCNTDNQVITQRLCPFQQSDMTVMQKIECSIGDHFDHMILRKPKLCILRDPAFMISIRFTPASSSWCVGFPH